MILERIKDTNDIKNLNWEELNVLASEIRQFLVEKVSESGGHLASNLGVVELTIAMHLAYDMPVDKMIWDVGHQAYTHKILTGRQEGFAQLRKYGGMSGFPKRKESDCDAFDTGHSSTSISAGIGYVEAREILKEDYKVVSVIGDGSFTGGMAYEALNNVSNLKSNYVIVLNDNNMSISENVGGMSNYLNGIRTAQFYNDLKKGVTNALNSIPGVGKKVVSSIRKTKNSIKQLFVPGMLFEEMGITYLGPVDGHDIKKLYRTLREAQKMDHAVLVHVLTQKGKGYAPAEQNPAKFHGIGPFEIATGNATEVKVKDTYTDVFGKVMYKLGEQEPKLTAITAAMKDGTGLVGFQKKYPERFFDVGIAEGHAVTFAAGLAAAGLKPVFAVYSSFLQRGYDQIVHDVCMQNLPVVFAIDRAGLVGSDGETHQGAFDMAYLSHIPNMTVLSPKNKWELADMLRFAVKHDGPIAVRYPRGTAYDGLQEYREPIVLGKSEVIHEEREIAIFSVGHMMEEAYKVWEALKSKGYSCSLINSRFVKPMDEEVLRRMAKTHKLFVTIEEGVEAGGYGERVSSYVFKEELPVKVLVNAIPDRYVEQGNIARLRKEILLDADSMVEKIVNAYEKGMN
ncbi:MAG: 1-deoxy-D-xylulose-5-phosphate synthase [Tyzzerella sp.]|nr:1-deoxy-D-xylulose-5-phosphate synthase [Tyzzerella sp.]